MSETELQNRGRKRRVLVVTGTRAEFGLLKPVMKAVLDREELELLVVATGGCSGDQGS